MHVAYPEYLCDLEGKCEEFSRFSKRIPEGGSLSKAMRFCSIYNFQHGLMFCNIYYPLGKILEGQKLL